MRRSLLVLLCFALVPADVRSSSRLPRPVTTGARSSVVSLTGIAPVVGPGQCLYLVGAPRPDLAAPTEATDSGAAIDDVCDGDAYVDANVTRPNSAQAYLSTTASGSHLTCHAESWIGHVFTVAAGAEPMEGHVDVAGGFEGILGEGYPALNTTDTLMEIEVVLLQQDPVRLTWEQIVRKPVFERTPFTFGRFEGARAFDTSVEARFRPGTTYAVRLVLVVQGRVRGLVADFGPPGTGTGAWYDAIEVCLDAPDDSSLTDFRLAALELADLEERLYRKECVPSVWLPAAHGGRLELARQLVVDLTTASIASADPNANTRLAVQRVAASDQDVAAGQYQRACKNLSDAMRALTTP